MFRLLQIYKSIMHGVGFIPLTVTIVLAIAALVLTLSPAVQSLNAFLYSGGYFEVRTPETARALLGSILAGVLSLTVFGFSMMMVVVNQAASIYSPKVVETLGSQRSNQYILGVNLGTIVFALIVMMHIDTEEVEGGIPELAVFATMVLTVYCLLLFVRFINNISNSVRINNIIKVIFKKTRHAIQASDEINKQPSARDISGWTSYTAGHSGYFQIIRTRRLLEILKECDVVMAVLPRAGTYYLRHEPLFATDKPVEPKTADRIRSEFVTYHGESISENPMYGFRQLREIAVKGLSPGINDPGVAILCIEHLAELLALRIESKSAYCISDEEESPRLIVTDFDFRRLLELTLVPIKLYGRRDHIVLDALLHATYQISLFDEGRGAAEHLQTFAEAVVSTAEENIRDPMERAVINERIAIMNQCGYFGLSAL